MTTQVTQRPPAAGPGSGDGPPHTPGWVIALRLGLIAAALALLGWVAIQAVESGSWIIVTVVAFMALAVLVVYGTRRAVPMKYLLPGLLLLLLFQIYPVAYTVATAFTNYGDGHTLSKEEAVAAIEANSVRQNPDSPRYGMAVAVPEGTDIATGDLTLLLSIDEAQVAEATVDEETDVAADDVLDGKALFVGTADGLTPLPAEGVTLNSRGVIATAPGYRVLNLLEANERGQELNSLAIPVEGGGIKAATSNEAYVGVPTISYDAEADTMTTAEGKVYVADEGRFLPQDGQGQPLTTGWTVNVGLDNFTRIFTDSTLRDGFLKIFAWNFAFALLSVATTFILGMLLALLFNDPRLRFKGLYRSVLILPYALPIFVTALVWAAMFNRDFGLINDVTGLSVNWLGGEWSARFAVLLTNLWLGFPYMFLICTGALQAIPGDVKEAAAVDGAGPWRQLRSITLPLLLVAVGPLLIASFAFNFNNFGLIYLLTGGGPFDSGNSQVGNTDLLITFAYRLALESGTPNIGLASAVSVVIFAIVGLISYVGFSRSKALEDVN